MAAERSQAAVSTLNGGRKTTAALAKSLRLAEKKTMLVQEVESARRETESWREIRRTKGCIGEVREWLAFIEGVRFAGKQLPISIRKETVEYIEMLLTAELVRLNRRLAN